MQAHSPRGIILGDIAIAKWRNLDAKQRLECHGQIFGGRIGPVTVMLHADAPATAVAAFYKVLAASQARKGIEA